MLPKDIAKNPLFLSRLSEAEVWCTRPERGEDPAGSLRTLSLMPALLVVEDENQSSWKYDLADPFLEIEGLSRKRAKLSAGIAPVLTTQPAPSMKGRVLLFYPQETLCDGAAWSNSKGFFDYWNIPPWDTWFWFSRLQDGKEILFSWVPPDFLDLALFGVSANPEQCLEWLDIS